MVLKLLIASIRSQCTDVIYTILAKISIFTGILVLPQIYVCIKNKPA